MNNQETKNKKDWDAICSRCARCCYEKIDFEGDIYYTDVPCEFLDLETNLCCVYTERESKRPGCVHLTQENIKKGFLPEDCPYVVDIEDYPAPSLQDESESDGL
jgi:uncharacterized cysteine cluster protein YcgN (CxxCxxCC family)